MSSRQLRDTTAVPCKSSFFNIKTVKWEITIYYITKANSVEHLEKLIVAQLVKKFPAFYGTRNSQGPATGFYPERDESSSHPSIYFSKIPSHL
jgi:hypothetical protein